MSEVPSFGLKPMLAKRVEALPKGDDWLFEPKWDGFRTIAFIGDDDFELQSRDLKPMARYFPEVLAPLMRLGPCVLDGELVIAQHGRLDFEALQLRLHPAESRVQKLAKETPAAYIAFDILSVADEDLRTAPFSERRKALEALLEDAEPPVHLTPMTTDRAIAQDWFDRFEGAGFDGVMAKDPNGVYEAGKRTMVKVKHKRTVDCVVAGFRWHKNGEGKAVGSLLLGLYDDEQQLHHVGVAASFTMKRREELVAELQPLLAKEDDEHPWSSWIRSSGDHQRVPGGQSRWSAGKDLSWVPLRAERVVEVTYDNMQGSRFRHTAHFKRWRTDKPPKECTYDQLERTPPVELKKIFAEE